MTATTQDVCSWELALLALQLESGMGDGELTCGL